MPSSPPTPSPSDPSSYLTPSFTTYLHILLTKHHVPGFSLAVISNTHIHATGYGTARFPSTPATATTLYPMCSTTKAFTTALLGILIEESQSQSQSQSHGAPNPLLTWQTPLSTILPQSFLTTSPHSTRHTTLEDLASHRSGIVGHDFLWGPWMGKSLSGATRTFRHLEPVQVRDVRGTWQYSNLGYATLGEVIEVVVSAKEEEEGGRERERTGVFARELRERILRRLGMEGTYVSVEEAKAALGFGEGERAGKGPGPREGWMEEWARPYYWRKIEDEEEGQGDGRKENEQGYYMPEPHLPLQGIEPAGSLISSVQDYAKWARALLRAAKKSKEEQLALYKGYEEQGKQSSTAADEEGDDNPITPSVWREVTTPRYTLARPFPNPSIPPLSQPQLGHLQYALGWSIERDMLPGHTIVCHGGGFPGIGTMVALLPDSDFGVVCAGNGDGSGLVCEAVLRELMGARVGLGEEERRRSWERKEEKPKESTQEGDLRGPLAPTGDEDQDTGGAAERGKDIDLSGKWHHPAYGTFELSRAGANAGLGVEKPELDGIEIVREKKDARSKQNAAQQPEPWLVKALGQRALHFCWLLHPAKQSTKAKDLGLVLFDQEECGAHGEISKDVFSELDRGWPELKDGEKLQRGVWSGQGAPKKGGTIVELVDGEKPGRLGMTLWRRMGESRKPDDDVLKDGWQDERIWFTPVHEQYSP